LCQRRSSTTRLNLKRKLGLTVLQLKNRSMVGQLR
ncbi:54K polar flagellar sheath A domain protein, partial [Vibrio harveyi]